MRGAGAPSRSSPIDPVGVSLPLERRADRNSRDRPGQSRAEGERRTDAARGPEDLLRRRPLRQLLAGAGENGVSQSTASQAVQNLEERLGVKLIDRSKRPLMPTPQGKVFYEGCRELVERYQELEHRVRALGNAEHIEGTVRVAAIYSVGLSHLTRHLADFRAAYPLADCRLLCMHPDEVLEQVREGGVELGIVSFPRKWSDLTVVPWREEEMVVAVPAGAPAGRRGGRRGRGRPARRRQVRPLRRRPGDPPGDRPLPEAPRGPGRARPGVRQHREHQAGRRGRRRGGVAAPADPRTRGRLGQPDGVAAPRPSTQPAAGDRPPGGGDPRAGRRPAPRTPAERRRGRAGRRRRRRTGPRPRRRNAD